MKSINRWHSIVALVVVTCMLVVPVSAFGKKGGDNFNRGMKYEHQQQWEKAAQEFTLALAADPSNVDYQLHYRRAIFNASQMFMQQGRSLAEARDYVGAYNAFRQAFGYDPVNQLAVSEMERMVRLQEVKEGKPRPAPSDGTSKSNQSEGAGTPGATSNARSQDALPPSRTEQVRVVTWNGDLKQFIRKMADELNLNVIFDRQTFAQPRNIDVSLRDVTTAKALDYIFLQENLFFQKLDRRTILVADQARRQQYQQLVVRTFYISNSDPDKAKQLITQALPASVGRPQSIVVSDKDTNSLTVRDTAENVKLIGDLLESIDKDRAEVVMDVNIYEVSRSDLLQFGNQLGDETSLTSLGGVRSMGSPLGQLARVITGTGTSATALPVSFGAALIMPASAIQALQTRNRTRLLASTQIHAFNNEESTARIGQRVPVQTAQAYPFGVQTGTQTPSAGGTNFPTGGFPVINYEPTGLTLNFTPQVFPNLDVQVKMKIESKDVAGASTLTPTFTERTITGTARIQNNRTMMLASVSQNIESNGRKGLPILSGLPVLGRLFSSPTKDNRQVDIVIAVTPRVLRAPAVTPRDEEMRPSGTLTSPTTGSLEAMMRETEREESFAAQRRIPRDVTLQLANATATYQPAPLVTAPSTANSANSAAPVVLVSQTNVSQTNNATPSQTQTAALTSPAKQDGAATDSAMPQPKALAAAASTEPSVPQKLDVASALKSIVSPTTGVSGTAASNKQDATLNPVVEDLAPKSEKTETTARLTDSIVELGLATGQGDMRVGEKRQLALSVKTGAPLGLAVLTLRFDPHVIKVNSVTAGGIFANVKTAPALSQSIDQNGMLLVSIAPAAGSPLGGEGVLLNIEFEATAAGDSLLAFDLANVHLVASDGRNLLLQVEPVKLTVK
jgi:general secretion pathway protein D